MTTKEHLRAALQHLIDLDQEQLSVSVIDEHTQDECYEQARIWLERAVSRSID